MDSYELLQNLDKQHGKNFDYTITTSLEDISKATKNVSKDRTEKAKKTMANILNGKNQEQTIDSNSGLQVEEIVVDDSSKEITSNENDKDER